MSSCSHTLEDVCVPITIEVEQTTFVSDSGWIAGAFFIGLFIGAIVAAALVRPCLREWQKKKRQDEEEKMWNSAAVAPVVTAQAVDTHKVVQEKTGKKKKGSLFKRRKRPTVDEDDKEDADIEPSKYRGMVDVIVQTSSVRADGEMAQQDLNSVTSMETDLDDERELLLLRCLDGLMKTLVVKKDITEDYYRTFMKRTGEDITDIRKIVHTERQEAEEEAKNNSKLSTDPQALDSHLENLQTQASSKQNRLQREQREKMRQDLIRSSRMSEAEVEALMEKLMGQMGALEEKIGAEQARQRRALQERLAKRRQVLEYNNMQADNQNQDINTQVTVLADILTGLVTDKKLADKQQEELLQQYREDVDNVRAHYNKEAVRQQESLAEKLQQRRQRRMHKLAEKQTKERATFVHTSDKGVSATEFIQGYHKLMCHQHTEREEVCAELDQSDIQDMDKVTKGLREQELSEVEEKLGTQMAEVGRQGNMGSTDVNRLLRQHRQQMDNYNGRKQKERQAMLARLQERLAYRLQVVSDQEQEEEMEMDTLRQQQTDTLNKVLSSNIELSLEARERILKEHNQNMQSLSNQLQRSKMRQQKSLEVKLNQRRAKLEDMQARHAEMRRAKQNAKQKEKDKLEQQLAAEMSVEEGRLEAGRQAALLALQQQLARETEEALLQQDQEISLLIGRLQVGQARRQAILRKQDKTMKELQDQLERRMTQGGDLPRSYTDQLIQQHHNQVENLNDHIQRNRQKQERIILEKLQTKRHMKENQLETQIEEETQVEYYHQQQHGAGRTSGVLMHILMEQRHQKAMVELETEMKTELEKSKEELNTALELELQKELESHKQQLLTQLAAVSGMSNDDLNDAVSAAATETGVGDEKAKKLAKELRVGIKRAKSSLTTAQDDSEEEYGLQRQRTDPDGLTLDYKTQVPRPASSKKKKGLKARAQPAFVENYGYRNEDDDDF
ncbi:trichohyalin-like [Haliotis cracherodii]|uniref:trichohyalin-like n=1 Tax=Haliotis cracherodii TaxID=6455 RepID=UPI0039EAF624